MRTSLRFRLTLTYLLVVLLGIGLVAPLAWLSVERLYLDTQQANLLAQAQLKLGVVRWFSGNSTCDSGSVSDADALS